MGAFKRIIEPRKQGESVVVSTMTESSTDHEESKTIVESMGRGVKKESAKMNISMYQKQVKLLDADVQKLATKFKKIADIKPTPPKEELNKSIL